MYLHTNRQMDRSDLNVEISTGKIPFVHNNVEMFLDLKPEKNVKNTKKIQNLWETRFSEPLNQEKVILCGLRNTKNSIESSNKVCFLSMYI